jgi:hypothetical protein
MSDLIAIKAGLKAAGECLCICDGECFETRHDIMNGPCEQPRQHAAAIVAAFLRELSEGDDAHIEIGNGHSIYVANFFWFADAVERAAQEAGDE